MKLPLSLLGIALWMWLVPAEAQASFGLTTATDYYTVDTGAGLVFKVRRTDNGASTQSVGDLMSLVYNGVEYQDQSRGSQLNSGFDYLYTGVSAVTVDAAVVNTSYVKRGGGGSPSPGMRWPTPIRFSCASITRAT